MKLILTIAACGATLALSGTAFAGPAEDIIAPSKMAEAQMRASIENPGIASPNLFRSAYCSRATQLGTGSRDVKS